MSVVDRETDPGIRPATGTTISVWRRSLIAVVVLREPLTRGSPGLLAGVTRPLVLLTVVNGLALAATSGFTTWLPSYYVLHGFNLSNAALLTAAMSAAAFVAQPLGGTISDRIGRRNLIVVALTGAAISLGCFLIARTGSVQRSVPDG